MLEVKSDNLRLAADVLQVLIDEGVREFMVCAGARNTPFVNLLANTEFVKKWYGFDERSASFFALGRIRQTGRPCAVVTTSGTAAGELLPAAMEGYYTSLPLVLLTADRPKRFRFVNTPQTCNQANLFGIYAPMIYDLEGSESAYEININRPVHLNICFEEPSRKFEEGSPLIERENQKRKHVIYSYQKFNEFVLNVKSPLIIVSTNIFPQQIKKLLLKLKAPCYLEAISHLREDPDLEPYKIYEPNLDNVDGVLRIGGVPTHRIWRDLENYEGKIEVLSITEHPFAGLSWGNFIHAPLDLFSDLVDCNSYNLLGKKSSYSLNQEEKWIEKISNHIPNHSVVYLGNSLPIREWDRAATRENKHFKIFANRGLNGIDGQVSTFLGLCEEGKFNWGIFGDLTALYDLQGLWYLSKMEVEDITLVVINNGGGMIFDKMFSREEMLNRHTLNFKGWAEIFGLEYFNELPTLSKGRRLIEIKI